MMSDDGNSPEPLHECDDQLIAVLRQLYDSTLQPRFQILVTQGFVELLVNAVIDAKCKNAKRITGQSRDFPFSVKLLLLHELGLISDRSYRVLNELRKHRNKAAHEPFYEVSDSVVFRNQTKATLHEFCINVICEFYSQHSEILAPIFAPKVSAMGGGVIVFPTQYRVSTDETPGK